jgi:hypothetical protein
MSLDARGTTAVTLGVYLFCVREDKGFVKNGHDGGLGHGKTCEADVLLRHFVFEKSRLQFGRGHCALIAAAEPAVAIAGDD